MKKNVNQKKILSAMAANRTIYVWWTVFCLAQFISGCKSPQMHRERADETAYNIIEHKQVEAIGRVEQFSLARPSDLLRRRLLTDQGLQYPDETSLGSDKLPRIEHWPDPNYLRAYPDNKSPKPFANVEVMKITLFQALKIGARNSFIYQSKKEDIFRSALQLDLEMNDFRSIFAQQFQSLISSDLTGNKTESGTANSSISSVDRNFENGAAFTADLAVDLINLLSPVSSSSSGVQLETSISIPLLRGSGKHIVREPLTQAERNVAYEIFKFEKFKREFAVDIANEYYNVLRKLDQVKNTEENYISQIKTSHRAKSMSDRLSSIQVDQAVQNELRARERWVSSIQSYQNSLDSFKILIGLPTDSRIELIQEELDDLVTNAKEIVGDGSGIETVKGKSSSDEIVLTKPGFKNPGPLEISSSTAVKLSFENRLDLRVAQGKVYDAQRDVVVAADDLRGELTLLGSARSGARRSVGSGTADNSRLRADKIDAFALLSLDLPIERTKERDEYRNSIINMEKILRDKNLLEDEIKLQIRNDLRTLKQTRESIQIQTKAYEVAKGRVKSTLRFLDEGRAQMRDVLEAQDSKLAAQNALTAAVVSYRIAELALQRDMGVLQVGSDGLWLEFLK